MPVTLNRTELQLDAVTDVFVSDVVQDDTTDQWTRRFEFYLEAQDASNRRPAITVIITSPIKLSVEVTVPSGVKF